MKDPRFPDFGSGNFMVDAQDKEDECQREDIGTGRYGCRCQECVEGFYNEAEYMEDR